MKRLTQFLVLVLLLVCSHSALAQAKQDSVSISQLVHSSIHLKLDYPSVNLDINSGKIAKDNKSLYLAYQNGMFEHYNYNAKGSTMSRDYKAHYPAPGFSFIHMGGQVRDSFNPHGADNIGSALVNGFLNGILLGNKY